MRRTISFLFFLSGFIGLLYEVLWAKYLALYLGSTALAQTYVLATFLGGLSLGNAFLGPAADAAENPIRLYGLLELGVALFGLASPILLRLAGMPSSALLQCALSAAALIPPAFLMGGTLPALSRSAARRLGEMQSAVAKLYFLNSAGAVAGALAAGFFLIPFLGLDASILSAAAMNLLVAAAALALGRRGTAAPAKDAAAIPEEPSAPAPQSVLLAAVFASGFAALAYEIAWNRLLALVLGSSAYSFSLMLAAFIAGIALGSLLVAGGRLPRLGAYALLGWSELALALSVLATSPFYDRLPWLALLLGQYIPREPRWFYVYEGCQLAICFILMLPPTMLLGMTLPLASRAAARGARRIGRDVGRVFALNTLGNVLGAAAAGLWLLPALGLQGLIEAGAAVNLLAGLAVLWTAAPWTARRKTALAAACILLCVGRRAWTRPLDKMLLSNGPFRSSASLAGVPAVGFRAYKDSLHTSSLLYYKDDREATVAVFEKEGLLWLKVNGKSDASSSGDMETQVLQAQIPLLFNLDAKDVLIVGLGSGTTAGSFLLHPVERVDVAELSAAVAEAARLFHKVNSRPLEDPRLRLHLSDGKAFLRRSARRYDIIASEPSNPWIAGVGGLFSVEYYREARAHLKPGGLVAQWFHLYEMTDDTLRLILRTFAAEFPHVSLWQTQTYDILLLGSERPLPLDFKRIAERYSLPGIRRDLERVGARRLATLMSLQLAGDAAVRSMAGDGPLNRDAFPRLEYEAPKAFFLNRDSRLPYDRDDRSSPTASRLLALDRYLAFRGKPLSQEEFLELAVFHGTSDTGFMLRLLRDWARSFPSDPQARMFLADAEAQAGDRAAAWSALRPLLARGCADARCLAMAAEYAPEPRDRMSFLRRLLGAPGADKADVYRRISQSYEAEDYEKAVDYLGKAAATAAAGGDRDRADSLWMEAALLAVRRYDVPLALSCAREALKNNPKDGAALDMIPKLLRVEALDLEKSREIQKR